MEKIKFKKTQSIEKFIAWIERFKGEISGNALTIEIDFNVNKFISKTFTQDKSLVRYSEIGFEDAGFGVDDVPPTFDRTQRLLFGTIALDKFIGLLKIFETCENFTMTPSFESMDVKGEERLCVKSIAFKSKKLNMNCPGASIASTELIPLDDKTLNEKVMVTPDPIKVTVSGDLIKNVICISDIFLNAEKLKNYMEFYTTTDEEGKKILKVRDPENNSYDYVMGEIEGELVNGDIKLPIYRDRFLVATKNAYEETLITISSTRPNRILIQLASGETKTIIAMVNR